MLVVQRFLILMRLTIEISSLFFHSLDHDRSHETETRSIYPSIKQTYNQKFLWRAFSMRNTRIFQQSYSFLISSDSNGIISSKKRKKNTQSRKCTIVGRKRINRDERQLLVPKKREREREEGMLERRLRSARNGIPRSQLRSHPDLTRSYSGLIVIAFCLFARRAASCTVARVLADARRSSHGRSYQRFCFHPRKTSITNYPTRRSLWIS